MTIFEEIRAAIERIAERIGVSPTVIFTFALGGSAAIGGLGLIGALLVHRVFWAIFGAGVVSSGAVLLARTLIIGGRRNGSRPRGSIITDAQVFALINSPSGGVSPSRLARATGTTVTAAEQKLDSLAIDGKVQVDSERSQDELFYVRSTDYLPR